MGLEGGWGEVVTGNCFPRRKDPRVKWKEKQPDHQRDPGGGIGCREMVLTKM